MTQYLNIIIIVRKLIYILLSFKDKINKRYKTLRIKIIYYLNEKHNKITILQYILHFSKPA